MYWWIHKKIKDEFCEERSKRYYDAKKMEVPIYQSKFIGERVIVA